MITGRAIYDGDWCSDDDYEQQRMKDDWQAYDKHPKRFMPTGSEGSLQRLVWINPDRSCAARYTVTVFGDLRDYDDPEAIHKWFDGVCEKCHIRQAVCQCDVSGPTYVYEYEWKEQLPVDADGVPIRVGDVMAYADNTKPMEVVAIAPPAVFLTDEGPRYSDMCRHYHAPTIEDVLRKFYEDFDSIHGYGPDEKEVVEKYAKRLQLKEVDE